MNFIGNIIDIEFSSSSFVKFWNRSKNKNLSYLDLKKGGGAINELSHEIDLVTYLFDFIKLKKFLKQKKSLDLMLRRVISFSVKLSLKLKFF